MGRVTRTIGAVLLTVVASSTAIQAQEKPKVVLAITVDQMRAEYLDRFAPHFTGGLARLLENGMVYRNCHYTRVPTYTAPGHATIFTGAQPADHGIIANDWYDPIQKRSVYCVEDADVNALGMETEESEELNAGQRSPKNLRTTTITDELYLSNNGQSYVAAVSIKDRGAILPGGHRPDEVYWFGDNGFVTSDYYTAEFPKWVDGFNREHADLSEYAQVWEMLLDESQYSQCLEDNNSYESNFGKENTSFPWDIPALIKAGGPRAMMASPDGNRYLTDFALELIDRIPNSTLEDDATDFISVSYSSTDYIGHAFGPRSREVMDAYLRLDIELERLFAEMDERVGAGNYIVFLSSDHGVAENPNHFREALGMNSTNISSSDLMADILDLSLEEFGFNPIEKISGDIVFLNEEKISEQSISIEAVTSRLSSLIGSLKDVKKAWTISELMSSSSHQAVLRANSIDERSGHLYIEWNDGTYIYQSVGASHGSGYTYDTHVPMVLMGANIPAGSVYRKVAVRDLAPTLCFLLKITLPHSAFGSPLVEVLPFIE